MIDFENMTFLKLRPVKDSHLSELVESLLCPGETICYQYQGIRDGIVFTNKRAIAINTQGLTGKKKALVTLPYKRIQAFSMETAGILDMDSEITLWFSGLGTVTFQLSSGADLEALGKLFSQEMLE
jgi:hypothetical protein